MNAIFPIKRDDSVTVPESDPFVIAGLILFGARWKVPMARALGVARDGAQDYSGRQDRVQLRAGGSAGAPKLGEWV
jgi:hypothetical protein